MEMETVPGAGLFIKVLLFVVLVSELRLLLVETVCRLLETILLLVSLLLLLGLVKDGWSVLFGGGDRGVGSEDSTGTAIFWRVSGDGGVAW